MFNSFDFVFDGVNARLPEGFLIYIGRGTLHIFQWNVALLIIDKDGNLAQFGIHLVILSVVKERINILIGIQIILQKNGHIFKSKPPFKQGKIRK